MKAALVLLMLSAGERVISTLDFKVWGKCAGQGACLIGVMSVPVPPLGKCQVSKALHIKVTNQEFIGFTTDTFPGPRISYRPAIDTADTHPIVEVCNIRWAKP